MFVTWCVAGGMGGYKLGIGLDMGGPPMFGGFPGGADPLSMGGRDGGDGFLAAADAWGAQPDDSGAATDGGRRVRPRLEVGTDGGGAEQQQSGMMAAQMAAAQAQVQQAAAMQVLLPPVTLPRVLATSLSCPPSCLQASADERLCCPLNTRDAHLPWCLPRHVTSRLHSTLGAFA